MNVDTHAIRDGRIGESEESRKAVCNNTKAIDKYLNNEIRRSQSAKQMAVRTNLYEESGHMMHPHSEFHFFTEPS